MTGEAGARKKLFCVATQLKVAFLGSCDPIPRTYQSEECCVDFGCFLLKSAATTVRAKYARIYVDNDHHSKRGLLKEIQLFFTDETH